MKYTLNPNPIFEDFVIMKSLCSKENKHYINKNNEIVFNAYKKNLPYYDHIKTKAYRVDKLFLFYLSFFLNIMNNIKFKNIGIQNPNIYTKDCVYIGAEYDSL